MALTVVIGQRQNVAQVALTQKVDYSTVQATITAQSTRCSNWMGALEAGEYRRAPIAVGAADSATPLASGVGSGWMTSIVNARCGQTLGMVDGRYSVSFGLWLISRRHHEQVRIAPKSAAATDHSLTR